MEESEVAAAAAAVEGGGFIETVIWTVGSMLVILSVQMGFILFVSHKSHQSLSVPFPFSLDVLKGAPRKTTPSPPSTVSSTSNPSYPSHHPSHHASHGSVETKNFSTHDSFDWIRSVFERVAIGLFGSPDFAKKLETSLNEKIQRKGKGGHTKDKDKEKERDKDKDIEGKEHANGRVSITSLNLGSKPPEIGFIHVQEKTTNILDLVAHIHFSGQVVLMMDIDPFGSGKSSSVVGKLTKIFAKLHVKIFKHAGQMLCSISFLEDPELGLTLPSVVDKFVKFVLHAGLASSIVEPEKVQIPILGKQKVSLLGIEVVEAINLIPSDKNGLSDPYCIVAAGKKSFRTQTILKNLNPKWNKKFVFTLNDPVDKISFSVFDWDFSIIKSDDFLGMAFIPFEEIAKDAEEKTKKEAEFHLPLQDKDDKKKTAVTGKIVVRTSLAIINSSEAKKWKEGFLGKAVEEQPLEDEDSAHPTESPNQTLSKPANPVANMTLQIPEPSHPAARTDSPTPSNSSPRASTVSSSSSSSSTAPASSTNSAKGPSFLQNRLFKRKGF